MDRKVYLDRVKKGVSEIGLNTLSKELNTSKQSITNWYFRGIPTKHIIKFCDLISKKRGRTIYPDFFSENYKGFYEYYRK